MLLIAVATIFFLLGFLAGRVKKRYEENIGEQAVKNLLNRHFANENYHLLNNITLPAIEGTTQIDHILVSTKGIFVIETKHYRGWIFGNQNHPKWTQVIFKFKNKFQNPLRQNYKHIKELRRYFHFLSEDVFKSVVVFTGDCEFKSKMPDNVLMLEKLPLYIRQYKQETISLNRLFFVVGKLDFFRKEISLKTDKEHIKYLRKKFGSKTTT